MIYSEKIQKAIKFAIKVHSGQTRKGKDEPYIIHPLSVGLIISRVTDDEDIIIAGILHDTIEDCRPYGSITKHLLAQEFGENVARMVNDVTEQDKSLSWEERKKLALKHIPRMSKGSLLVKSVDVLHNMTDQIADYKAEGEKMFKRFNAGKDKQLKRYERLIKEIGRAYLNNPLREDLKVNFKKLQTLWH